MTEPVNIVNAPQEAVVAVVGVSEPVGGSEITSADVPTSHSIPDVVTLPIQSAINVADAETLVGRECLNFPHLPKILKYLLFCFYI